VTRSFGSEGAAVQALRGVTLDVPASRLVMLVGPSGCGKTTLVSVISGVLRADSGSAEVFGVDWASLTSEQAAARRGEILGFVFQSFNLIPTLTVAENASVPLLVRGVPRREATERASLALASVGLGDRQRALPSEFSGGMQQRVAIARALVGQPRLIVCDEPTAALDGRTGQQVMELIHAASRSPDHRGRPRCVIVVTHDTRIFHYADQIIEMEDGRLKAAPSRHIVEEAREVPRFADDENGSAAPPRP
jgi:putative ABC transport system ATP-binding protein